MCALLQVYCSLVASSNKYVNTFVAVERLKLGTQAHAFRQLGLQQPPPLPEGTDNNTNMDNDDAKNAAKTDHRNNNHILLKAGLDAAEC